jgi:hypothetical protein
MVVESWRGTVRKGAEESTVLFPGSYILGNAFWVMQ